ncbi:Orotate phosphoribosyltransferase (chromatophore) [Paulinella micropora]|uniref:orotate phosphoribosyltransferase n=1 Tax=Paulinella micropora TaxID=1928728 RepID=A0A1L5YC54_9EUKA|nr:orotate phosphoribosyltransferase [Paulinella micropora]AQX45046.1 Orotate phosphoribosyltransferase [Paulinella micropora]BBL86259.1 Orotate phosphoribosyltransferase [Paulinella micropora]
MVSQFLFDLCPGNSDRRSLLLAQLSQVAYRYGQFTLSSGRVSHHYVNCKPVSLSSNGLVLISNLMLEEVENEAAAVAGLTLGADPLVSGVAQAAFLRGRRLDALIVRKSPKGHGSCSSLEGPLPRLGSRVTLLEDVVTTGTSSLKATRELRNAGYIVERIITIVDREEGGKANIEEQGLELVSLFSLSEIITEAQNPRSSLKVTW